MQYDAKKDKLTIDVVVSDTPCPCGTKLGPGDKVALWQPNSAGIFYLMCVPCGLQLVG